MTTTAEHLSARILEVVDTHDWTNGEIFLYCLYSCHATEDHYPPVVIPVFSLRCFDTPDEQLGQCAQAIAMLLNGGLFLPYMDPKFHHQIMEIPGNIVGFALVGKKAPTVAERLAKWVGKEVTLIAVEK